MTISLLAPSLTPYMAVEAKKHEVPPTVFHLHLWEAQSEHAILTIAVDALDYGRA